MHSSPTCKRLFADRESEAAAHQQEPETRIGRQPTEEGRLKMKISQNDVFLAAIHRILQESVSGWTGREFRNAVVLEVQSYSQRIDDQQHVSELFLKVCDLLLDCNPTNIPDNSFKMIIANLVHESSYSNVPPEDAIRQLTGFSVLEMDQAQAALGDRECLYRVSRGTSNMHLDKQHTDKREPRLDESDDL
jgi:hypothetical protein